MNELQYAIDVHNLNKFFGKNHVVRNLSLQVSYGEIFGFLGPNGSGKTTTIRMMCGLMTPDSGTGYCLGYDINQPNADIKRNIGYMTQRFSLWEDLTIAENLCFVARIYDVANASRRIVDTLEQLQLSARSDQLAGTLSGGWKQRLSLAACMLHDPKLLLLDEPTAGVDPQARRDFWNSLHMLADKGVSILVTTHYMDEAERCHKLAYIVNGQLLAQGTSQEIVTQQKLKTFSISGHGLMSLAQQLEGEPGVEQTILFGSHLHVSGRHLELLQATLKTLPRSRWHVETLETTLEDVFINLMHEQHPEQRG